MAKVKGGALATVMMIVAFLSIGVAFYWLSITAVPAEVPVAVEEESVETPPAEMPSEEVPVEGEAMTDGTTN